MDIHEPIHIGMDQHRLLDHIQKLSVEVAEKRMLGKQYKQMLEAKRQTLVRQFRGQHSAARSERLALVDDAWLKEVEDYTRFQLVNQTCKIQLECHQMLAKARQSLRGYYRLLHSR